MFINDVICFYIAQKQFEISVSWYVFDNNIKKHAENKCSEKKCQHCISKLWFFLNLSD